MKTIKQNRTRIFSIIASLFLVLSFVLPVSAQGNNDATKAKLSEDLLQEFDSNDEVDFIVTFKEKANTTEVANEARTNANQANLSSDDAELAQREAVIDALKTTAETTQEDVSAYLDENSVDSQSFYITNAITVTATKDVAEDIKDFDEVASIIAAPTVETVEPVAEANDAKLNSNVLLNVDMVNPLPLWEEDVMGEGVVIGSMDSGAQWDHDAIKDSYRGYNAEDGSVDHVGNFFDAVDGQDEAYDDDGHGTHTIGTMTGYVPEGSDVPLPELEDAYLGVAPGAEWISAKILNAAGDGSTDDLLEAAEWMMAPNGDASLAPDVVNNSWGFPGADPIEDLDEFFRDVVVSWKDAGIFPVFAAGNEVPGVVDQEPGTVSAPAAYPEAFAVGAIDYDKNLSDFTLLGPSPYDEIKPEVVAPGVEIISAYPGDGYVQMGGTSMAAPAVAGVAALLIQNNPDASIEDLEEAMKESAEELTNDDYPDSPNNGFGWGLVDAAAADEALVEEEPEPEPKEVDRLAGKYRYHTALEISQDGWEDGSLDGKQVVVARADNFADALAGVPLADAMESPILLVPTDADEDNEYVQLVKEEMDRLGAQNAIILGGDNAINNETENTLNDEVNPKNRLDGDNRVETAVEIANWLVENSSATGEEAVVVNGYDFADALSVASSAAQNDLPILLTQAEKLSDGTKDALDDLGVKETYAIGGDEVVADNVFNELPEATRVAGKDRWATNTAIVDEFGVDTDHVYVATGYDYPDALSGAALAAKNNSTVVLSTHVDGVFDGVKDTIKELNPEEITVFGGPDAVKDSIVDQLEELLNAN